MERALNLKSLNLGLIPDSTLSVTLGKLLNIAQLQFLNLKAGDKATTTQCSCEDVCARAWHRVGGQKCVLFDVLIFSQSYIARGFQCCLK